MMVEIWDSIESHQASVKNIPPDMIAEIRPLLAGSPSGRYFDIIAHTRALPLRVQMAFQVAAEAV
jgi:hypothetical protein